MKRTPQSCCSSTPRTMTASEIDCVYGGSMRTAQRFRRYLRAALTTPARAEGGFDQADIGLETRAPYQPRVP